MYLLCICSSLLDIRCVFVLRSLCINFALVGSLVGSLTGEARMFWLDEVGNSKKIVIKGKLARPASPPLIVRCFYDLSFFA